MKFINTLYKQVFKIQDKRHLKRVLLRFYSQNNLGDDLFIRIITERYINNFSIIIPNPGKSLRSISNLKIYSSNIEDVFFRIIQKMKHSRYEWMKHLLRKNDLLVHIGGSLFIENKNYEHWQHEALFHRNCKKPYYILGSNVGPYETDQFLTLLSEIFVKSKDVCFRDEASYEIFKTLKTVRLASDIVFSLNVTKYSARVAKTAVFSIIDAYEKVDKVKALKYEDEIINLSKNLLSKGYKVVYMSFCKYEGDERAIERIVSKLPRELSKLVETHNYIGDLDAAIEQIANCEIVVASRFHASILGLVFGKKVLPIAYSNKTTNILRDIKFNGPIVDIRSIDEFDGRSVDFLNLKTHDISRQKKISEAQFYKLDKVLVMRTKDE